MEERKPNLLVNEKSPYLQEHAYNPVMWRAWNPESLKKAKNDNKPIFLSIGYSTCHWCHVLRKESFEDEQIAALINKNFIPIKVDREERPEVDAYYMAAVQAMTGSGGWPLNVFLTPDLKPFYGGTYFPPEPRYGMASFRQVLEFVDQLWRDRREEIMENSEQVTKAIARGLEQGKSGELTDTLLDDGYKAIVSTFDPERGGFGNAPKFPVPLTPTFLLRYNFRKGTELSLRSVLKTLDSMKAGGIRDHVGGGFHRYSTDKVWLVPHFEKMLYDNALIAKLYAEAYQVTGNEQYLQLVRETLGWLLGEMRDEGGGFYSAQDADTTEGEGVYYTWTPEELRLALGAEKAELFERVYGVTKTGNFEGRNILHLEQSSDCSKTEREMVAESRRELYGVRLKRPRPHTDTKVLTSWNGLAVSALAFSGAVLAEHEYLEAAERAADFVLAKITKEGRLLRRFAGGEGALDGTLEDYAFFVQGLIDLFEADSEPKYLREAVRLTKVMMEDLEDTDNGGFFLTITGEPVRLKENYDGPTPSGNSVAALNLIRLAELTGDESFRHSAERVLAYFRRDLEAQPTGHACMLVALDLFLNGTREVVITSKTKKNAEPMKRAVFENFVPDKVVLAATAKTFRELSGMTVLLEGREPREKARAFVCQNFACKLPADSVKMLKDQLENKGRPYQAAIGG